MRSDRYEIFEQKTEDWLSAADLRKSGRIIATVDEIRSALYRHQKDMPEYIKIKGRKTRTVICLFNDGQIVDQFRKLAGFSTQEEKYVSKWLSAQELENTHVCASADVIKNLLYQFQPEMPKYIQVKVKRVNNYDRRVLCLFGNPLVIRSFCIMAKLQQPTAPKPHANEWLTIGELCKKIGCKPADLLNVLQSFQTNMPEDINPQMIFAIRNDANVLGALRNKLDLALSPPAVTTVSVPSTTTNAPAANEKLFNADDWISLSGLIRKKISHGTAEKISSGLKKWQETHPDDIFEKMFKGNPILYLRNEPSVIQQFNEMLDSKERKPRTRSSSEIVWLSVAELFKRKIVRGRYQKVENALKKWRDTNPDNVLLKTHNGKFSYYLRNDNDVIKRFSEILETKKPKPAEKKTTENLSEQWLSANDLECRYIDAGFTYISEKLYLLQHTMPDLIQSQGYKLCLKGSAIQEFCKKAGFPMITPKTSGWLSATDLVKQNYVPGSNNKVVRNTLLLNKSYKPDYVQTKMTSTGILALCLLDAPDAITWLRKKLMLSPTLFPDEAPKWVLVDDLPEKYIIAPLDKIRLKLEEFSDLVRNDIWHAKDKGHRVTYLYRDSIEKFCQIARFKMATEVATTMSNMSSLVDLARVQSKQKS